MKTHTKEKPNKCDWCDYGTAQKCNLTLRIRTHSLARPYKCDYYQTPHKGYLTRRLRNQTVEK